MSNFFKDPASRFCAVQLTQEQQQMAMNVPPEFFAYLQNKIEAYASALVVSSLPYDPDPKAQVKAILEHERLKNFIAAYEELFVELQPTSSQTE